MIISCERIRNIVIDALVKESDGDNLTPDQYVVVDGIINKCVFHKERLEAHRGEVQYYIDNIKDMKEGISFLSMCQDKEDSQWGEHPNCEELLLLGLALDILQYPLPREAWQILPGAVPYIILKNRGVRSLMDKVKIRTGRLLVGNFAYDDEKDVKVWKWAMEIEAPICEGVKKFYINVPFMPNDCVVVSSHIEGQSQFVEMNHRSEGYEDWLEAEFKYCERVKKLLCSQSSETIRIFCAAVEEIDQMEYSQSSFIQKLADTGFIK